MYATQMVGETRLDAINNCLDIPKKSFKFSTRAEVSHPIYTPVLAPYSRTATAAIAKSLTNLSHGPTHSGTRSLFNRPPCTRPTLSNPSTQLKKGKPPSQPCTNLAPPLPTDGIPGSKFKSRGFSGREFEKTWITSVFFSRARFRARARVRRFTRYHKVCEGDKPTLYLYCSTRTTFIVNARNKRSNYGTSFLPAYRYWQSRCGAPSVGPSDGSQSGTREHRSKISKACRVVRCRATRAVPTDLRHVVSYARLPGGAKKNLGIGLERLNP